MTKLIRSPLFTGAGLAAALVGGLAFVQSADAGATPGGDCCVSPQYDRRVEVPTEPFSGQLDPGAEVFFCGDPEPQDEKGGEGCEQPGSGEGCVEPQAPICEIPEPQPVAEVPLIEVVFVVDTTGSMSNLIEGAKRKVWSIANEILSAKPRPRLSVGMVAYRDYSDAYVTQVFQPTEDLDAVYANLQGFSADGGGDTPEHVNMALAAAFGQPSQHDCQGRCSHRVRGQVGEAIRWSDEAKLKLVFSMDLW